MITFEINDWINVSLSNQNISNLSKFDKNEHVKRNFEPSIILNSIGELKLDWNAIVLCLLNLFNNVDDDDEQLLIIIINKYYFQNKILKLIKIFNKLTKIDPISIILTYQITMINTFLYWM